MVSDLVCNFIESTGDKELDDRILDLAKSVGGVENYCLLAEMIFCLELYLPFETDMFPFGIDMQCVQTNTRL